MPRVMQAVETVLSESRTNERILVIRLCVCKRNEKNSLESDSDLFIPLNKESLRKGITMSFVLERLLGILNWKIEQFGLERYCNHPTKG